MKQISFKERVMAAVGVYGIFFLAYIPANRLVPLSRAIDLTLPVDKNLPFLPEFVYPFYLVYMMLGMPAFIIQKRLLFMAGIKAFAVLILISVILFIVFPVMVPRPALEAETFSEKLVAAIYAHDRPVCGFPSLHVSASLLMAMIVSRQDRRYGVIFYILFVFTSLATVFIRQHVVADVVGGIMLAWIVDGVCIGKGTRLGENSSRVS